MKMETVDFEALKLLLKAPAKDAIIRICNEAFLHRMSVTPPVVLVDNTTNLLIADRTEVIQMLQALKSLVKNAIYKGSTEPADIVSLFPGDFHKNLRDLLGRILIENLPRWRDAAVNSLVSLPRLVDFDWRVDIKTSSDCGSRMAVPSCILQLQVQENQTTMSDMPPQSAVTVELSKETLDTMLDGLGKIRDQLSSVARTT